VLNPRITFKYSNIASNGILPGLVYLTRTTSPGERQTFWPIKSKITARYADKGMYNHFNLIRYCSQASAANNNINSKYLHCGAADGYCSMEEAAMNFFGVASRRTIIELRGGNSWCGANFVGVSLILCYYPYVSLAMLLSGKTGRSGGKIVRASLLLLLFALSYGEPGVPNYENRGPDKLRIGQAVKNVGDYENALLASKVSYWKPRPIVWPNPDIRSAMIQAEAWLNRAKDIFNAQGLFSGPNGAQPELSYIELEEAKDLLPQYESAAR
jgi:hypothetical protein